MPGDYDPSIAIHLSLAEKAAESKAPPDSELSFELAERAAYFQQRSQHMRPGKTVPWWDRRQKYEKMSYECDEALGNPGVADCTQIQVHQIGNLNGTLEITPDKPKFLNSGQLNREESITTLILHETG